MEVEAWRFRSWHKLRYASAMGYNALELLSSGAHPSDEIRLSTPSAKPSARLSLRRNKTQHA
jgi:hypothetical protein